MSKEEPHLFQSTITKISVAQICQSIGFTGCQSSALESFSKIATLYLQTLAKSAVMSANSSGRSQCNLFDLILGLEDLGFVQETNLKKSLLKSGVLREIMRFVNSIDEIPFAKPIPRRNYGERLNFLVKGGGRERFSHIPKWLPSFPDSSSYKNVGGRVCNGEEKFGLQSDNGVVDGLLLGDQSNNVEKIVPPMGDKSFLPVKRAKVKFKLRLKSANVWANVELGMRNGSCRDETPSIGDNVELGMNNGSCRGGTTSFGDNFELKMRNGTCRDETASIGDNVELEMRNRTCRDGRASIGANVELEMRNGTCRDGKASIGANVELGMRSGSCRDGDGTTSIGANVELGMRNGICRGGKRISWCNPIDQKEIKVYKRRKNR